MKKLNTIVTKEQIEDIKNFKGFDAIAMTEQKLVEEIIKFPIVKNVSTRTLASQLWSYKTDVGWYDDDGYFRGLYGNLQKEKKEIKRVYSKDDPYGEENWDE